MTLPRELSVRNGRLFQQPVRELEQYRSSPVSYKGITVQGSLTLSGVEGRTVDMELTVRPGYNCGLYQKFAVYFAQNEQYKTSLSFRLHENGVLKLRIILDRFSAEVFVNDGEQVMSATISTDLAAQGISFFSDGQVLMDITKYDLFAEG